MSVSDAGQRRAVSDPSTWLDEHGDYLFACAVSLVRDANAAEDLVQETLLAAVQGASRFEGRAHERTWLYAILKRKAADHLRQARRAGTNAGRVTTITEEQLQAWAATQFARSGKWKTIPARWPADASQSLDSEDFQRVLADCLSRLPEKHAEAVLLAAQRGLSLEQLGKILSATPTNIGVILHRTRLALRHCLERKWFTPERDGGK